MIDPQERDPEEELPDEGELSDKMSFLEHLDELRTRLIYSIISIAVAFVVTFYYYAPIFYFMEAPLRKVMPPGQDKLYFIAPTEGFGLSMKVAFVAAIFLASPFLIWQLWLFISPGLYRKEKKYVLPFLLSSTVLFLSGGAFGYYILLPGTLKFLIYFNPGMTYLPKASEYFGIVTWIMLGMGGIFQLPVLIAFLSIFGIVTPRFLIHNFKYAFLLAFVLGAVISPTGDPFNLMIYSVPLVVLYLVGIGVSFVFAKLRKKRERGL
ncbi:MAG TPA: twin-arginine translocase subunit TatC [Acidobacteriota bacterium]|jgi:sec-independent protein translocase protein TatC